MHCKIRLKFSRKHEDFIQRAWLKFEDGWRLGFEGKAVAGSTRLLTTRMACSKCCQKHMKLPKQIQFKQSYGFRKVHTQTPAVPLKLPDTCEVASLKWKI